MCFYSKSYFSLESYSTVTDLTIPTQNNIKHFPVLKFTSHSLLKKGEISNQNYLNLEIVFFQKI